MTDAGLVHFKDCKKLVALELTSSEVTDAGLAHFKDCKKLGVLALADTVSPTSGWFTSRAAGTCFPLPAGNAGDGDGAGPLQRLAEVATSAWCARK